MSFSRMRIGLDLRWLQQAYINSPKGGLGGIGTFCRGLWLGLARAFPDVELVALVSRGAIPEDFLRLIQAAPKHQIQAFGLSGFLPSLDSRGQYTLILRILESELGLAARLDKLGLDVLHMLDHTPPPRRVSCPTVVTVYDLIGLKGNAKSLRAKIFEVLQRKQFLNIKRASLLVSISQPTRDNLARYFPQRADHGSVVFPGIDVNVFKQRAHSIDYFKQRFSLRGDYFIHVGILTDRKNPLGLIRAMRRVVDTYQKEIMLVCVGPYQVSPAARERVVELAREYGIENHLLMLGDVSTEELASLYQHALGLVFPSFAEGFGLPALECLACGTPCVVSQTTSLPEVVGDLGILVDPYSAQEIADGMLRLLADEPYRDMIKAKGPLWAQRFSFEAMAVSYMRLYRSLAC